MIDSVELYKTALQWQNLNLRYNDIYKDQVKNSYLQTVTAIFYELVTQKNSPLLSEMCAANDIDFAAKNFKLEKINARLEKNSVDMYCIVFGLNEIFSKNLDACANFYETVKKIIFTGKNLGPESFTQIIILLKNIDKLLKKFSPQPPNEEKILLQELNSIAKNRTADDEKIIAEIIKVQAAAQNSLKAISEIRDGLDFRTLQEPITQLIFLYHKLDDNLKRHPQTDAQKGYSALIKRCQKFLDYITQSLEMLGVELISASGGAFNPDLHKILDDEKISTNSTVTKIKKIGFIYKGKILEKATVEVGGGETDENRN